MPQPQFISQGRSSQGMPVLRTNRMPVRAARSVTGGWPPLGLGVHLGSKGSMTSHSSSGSKGLAMIVISWRKFPREEGAISVPNLGQNEVLLDALRARKLLIVTQQLFGD